eukprot:GFKZ01012880.1.p1 GENE.GFKZ01012880.1~~GFKZ01012880.1.p1  ORF type:complete len:241 (-),score=39.96 GFKZ01012880.1:333-1055(-)
MATSMKAFRGNAATGARRAAVVPRAESDRRAALLGLAAVPAVLTAKPAEAAYGDAANVFGKSTNTSGFIPYTGEGFAVLLPSKYNPSKEKDFPGTVLRYEDNGDQVSHMIVIKMPSSKSSIEQYGSTDAFLGQLQSMGLFGKQAYTGSSKSEGGFADGRYAAGSLLDVTEKKDSKGKNYYKYQLLIRSADGDEGGRHQLVSATVGGDGQLYICKVQIGDKRWFKGANKEALGIYDSFIVA